MIYGLPYMGSKNRIARDRNKGKKEEFKDRKTFMIHK